MIRRGSSSSCVAFPVFLFGDFRSSLLWFSWRSFEDVFLWDSCWVSLMRTLCLFGCWLCPKDPLESDSIWWFFVLLEFLPYRDDFFDSSRLWAIRADSLEVEVAQEVTQLFPKFCCNPWSDSGDRVMGSWGLTCGLVFWKGRSNRLGGRSNRPRPSRWRFLFCWIFLCEFVCLDRRSVLVKSCVVFVQFARCSCLEFFAGYRRLDCP
jgi:hypothetical protein